MHRADQRAASSPKSEDVSLADYAAEQVRPWLWMADPDQLDDLASDMSVFHGIRDIGAMRSDLLARLALRIGAYRGALSVPRGPVPPPVPQRPVQSRRRDPGPVATADQLRAILAPVPGSQAWGTVRTVPREEWDKPPEATAEPDGG